MIRIDEIYDHTFLPYIKKYITNTCMFYHDPPGRIDPESLLCSANAETERSYIYFFDQEPVEINRMKPTLRSLISRTAPIRQEGVLVTSEKDSDNADALARYLSAGNFYYFFHGWAALDWYRGYNRTFMIQPWGERQIGRTFISPNRIIGGERLHRVAMLYHFEKYSLFHNHISAPRVCPVENEEISHIARQLQTHYPDIVDTLYHSRNLPKTFPGEHTQEMHSYWLSLFDQACNSLLYHVTETVYFGRRLHLTEKSFKPIAMGMPFVLTAPAGSLEYLRSYGFKTFGHLWDESYDQEQDDHKRLHMIATLLKQLDDLTRTEKQQLFESAIPVITHNWEHFYWGNFERILWQELMQMLEDIDDHLGDR